MKTSLALAPAPALALLALLTLIPSSPALAKTSLDKIVGAVVRKAYPQLHTCFRKALARDRGRSGTIFIQVTLGREDRVNKAKAVRDELDHTPTASCLVAQVIKWRFPGAAAAGAGSGSDVVIPLTLNSDPYQFAVYLPDVDPGKSGAAVVRPLLTGRSVGAQKANVAYLNLDGKWEARAPAGKDLVVVVVEGSAGKDLGQGAALYLPAGSRREIQGKASALIIMSAAAGGAGKKSRAVKPGKTRKLKGGKLKVTPLVGRPGAGTGSTYVGYLEAAAGFKVKPHHHNNSDEQIFVLSGVGRTTLGDREALMVTGVAANLPAQVGHSMEVLKAMKVVQIYAPAGPEERFFKAPPPRKKKLKRKRRKR